MSSLKCCKLKSEEQNQSFQKRVSLSLQDFENRSRSVEEVLQGYQGSFTNMKKDLYNQIFDNNSGINEKFDIISSNMNERIDNQEKLLKNFKETIIVLD